MKIVLIGAGNVAFHLGPILKNNGHKILQVYNRSSKAGLELAGKLKSEFTGTPEKINTEADIYIIMLNDEAVSSFIKKLNFIPKLIIHTSGTTGMNVFPKKYMNHGVLYPLQTFSKRSGNHPVEISFLIEAANEQSLKTIMKLAKSIGKYVKVVNTYERRIIHLAAVFANNFTNHLFTLSDKILKSHNLEFEILRPIILETAHKIISDNPAEIQTGPARRGDQAVIKKHLELLKDFPEMKVIYKAMSKSIEEEYKRKK